MLITHAQPCTRLFSLNNFFTGRISLKPLLAIILLQQLYFMHVTFQISVLFEICFFKSNERSEVSYKGLANFFFSGKVLKYWCT